MDYFNILNLKQEPFSNSPDPEFFFHSREHQECLQKLELSLLLRRGLNVIIGDVGTGKTTLCRQLIRRFARRDEIITHLILDPTFADARELLTTVGRMLMGNEVKLASNEWQIKEQIKQYLFKSGVKEDKTTVLIIDEGQKVPPFCLEILREFLNYETNEFKLLQIIIFAQEEFENTIKKYANFADRINLYHYLKPLNFRDTRLMIKFRLEKSKDTHKKIDFFSYPAMLKIYRATGGYPRKIINLCHHCILAMIVQNRKRVSASLVRSCIKRAFPGETRRWKSAAATAAVAVVAAMVIFALLMPERLRALWPRGLMLSQNQQVQHQTEPSGSHTGAVPEASSQQDSPQNSPQAYDSDVDAAAVDAAEDTGSETVAQAAPDEQETVAQDSQIAAIGPSASPAGAAAAVESGAAVPNTATNSEGQQLPERAGALTERTPYAPLLGNITLKRDDTLSQIIEKVYGSYNSRYFRSLILANPIIDDPDLVEVNQTISMPAIPATVAGTDRNAWWVLLEDTDDLNTAFDYLRTYPATAPAARMIPYWNQQSGIRFAITLKGYHADADSALEQLKRVPAELAPARKVLSSWNKDTVFFANPYSGPSIASSIQAQGE
ncbi:MAG: AAA family ATPase [Deltaproteobacteria bacterium]|jgi:general secretion pathway protein A|nr:AAA family ATPase [Deltaproteobacteria bacterium]